jgi:ribosomal-protein-alanine N-acetyltransferase
MTATPERVTRVGSDPEADVDAADGTGGGRATGPDAIVVAPMRRRHLRGVMAIEERTNHRPWSMGLFMGELRMPTSRSYVVALDGHEVAGFCGLMLTGDEGHITNIAVHPDRRRRAIAARLMLVTMRRAVELGLCSITLEVRMSNTAAQELYRRFGFAPGGIRRNYYQDVGEDGLIMWAHDIDTDDYADRLAGIQETLPSPLRTEGIR